MPGARIDGVALGSVAVGSVLLYAGIKGKSIPAALQAIVQGKSPAAAPQKYPITSSTGTSGGGSIIGGAPAAGDTGAHGNTASVNQGIASLLAAAQHPTWVVGQEWKDWLSLWNQESGWNNLALNSSSGAFGVAQALGHGVADSAGKYGNQYPSKAANDGDATAQIQWGIDYIAQSYGSPSKAWAHEVANNWY